MQSKPDLSLVTDADRAVEQAIAERLASLGRVTRCSARNSARSWVAPGQPSDSGWSIHRRHAQFRPRRPGWASLIGLLVEGEPVVGMVSAPALGQRWWAAAGQGAFGQAAGGSPRRLRVSAVSSLSDASMSYSSLPGWAAVGRLTQFLGLLDGLWRSRAYGDFWSYMLVAEGSVDLAAEPELSLWDMAALAPIVTEAGGRFTGLNGVAGVHQGNAAASNGLLHKALLAAVGTG